MLLPSCALLFALAAPPAPPAREAVAWTRDQERALAEAEERSAPLLLYFRNQDCETRSGPYSPAQGRRDNALTDLNDCDLMQQEVWEEARVAAAARRFVAVLVDGGDHTLNVRYRVATNPTTVVADPWGNEVFRFAHYLEPRKVARLLEAIPADFRPLAPWARALRRDGSDLEALLAAAGFYQGQRLPQVSERFYQRAAATPRASAELAVRRQVAIARGLNLLLMGSDEDAVAVFERALAEAPQGPGSDALLLGLVNAHVQGGRRRAAEAALRTLEKGWAGSPYTARARVVLGGAGRE